VIFIYCTLTTCRFVARIHGPDVEEVDHLVGPSSQWYPDKYPCPVCGERCAISTRSFDENYKCVDLTPQEAFIAFSGGGLPGEAECSASRVSSLLVQERVTNVKTRHIKGTNRCVIDRLQLESGIVLHLGASVHGACVYRVQEPPNYTEDTEVDIAAQQLTGGKSA
jgi:hypothetical protein